MQLRLFKKKEKKKRVVSLCQGVTLTEEISMGDMTPGRDAIVKGLIEVCIVFGSVGGFLSCFDISYYVPVVALFYVIIAAYFSYLFKTGKTLIRDIGYVVFFVIYVFGIIVFHRYINSGFYAIINIIYDSASTYFDLPAVREVTEYISNRNLTITVMAAFIGCVEIIILNIYLSTYMSILAAVMISVPLFTVPLFFNLEPDSFYMILLFAGLLSVLILKGNRRYAPNRENTRFSYSAKKRRIGFFYSQSGKAMAEMIFGSLLICFFIIAICNILYPKEKFIYRFRKSSVKVNMEDPIENVMLTGFSSLFNFYGSTSGMSGGKLGGVSSVRSDYQTDLEVTFTPYSYDTIYLKGFTGERYGGNQWSRDTDEIYHQPVDGTAKGTMLIKNVGADDYYMYMPYYTVCDETLSDRCLKGQGIPYNMQEEYTYYPYNDKGEKLKTVKDSYLEVPENNLPVIKGFCEEAGFHGTGQELIAQVKQYFQDNIPYTLRPGSMPRKADFVNFFLEENKKGYCAHFASAATLIFRYYGIPARYIEGYAIPYTLVADSDLQEELKYEDFFSGEAELGRTAVITASVTDANAHAWVEVFLDGTWQVAEVTPASDEEEIDDFWTLFGNLLTGGDDEDNGIGQGENTGNAFSLDRLRWLWYMIAWGIIIVLCCLFGGFLWRKGKRIASYHQKDMGENVIAYYHYMCMCMEAVDETFLKAGSHYDQLLRILAPSASEEPGEKEYSVENPDIRQLSETLERISYSSRHTGQGEKELLLRLKNIFRERKKRCSLRDKVYLFLHI